ncbi:hypothetical protein CKO11_07200 [Rhodobacter sp. TJ_12]|uniref:hypothetical protein n=1 Tax=Rhodobacter sp. TJ_12 TaxID=2029399 RepID=UPI001CBFC378|nr:hypothetical protein [Rhodobacter sp. TJ_12]MBZ4022241.1 hypothetical protein [Rhodobacter sp. TJ_12]
MDVILHLGAHRTATTSFQGWMVQNEDSLTAAGIAVWGPQVTRAGRFAGLTKRPEWLTGADEQLARRSAAEIRYEIDKLAASGHRALVISDENFLGTMPHCLEQLTLYPDAGARLRRVIAAIGPHLTGLALAIRRPDTFWTSVLEDQRARGRAVPGPRGLDRLANHPRGWKRVVQVLREEAMGRPVTVWPFETMVGQNTAQMRALLGAHHLPVGLFDHGRAMNAAPAPMGARVSPFSLAQRAQMAAGYRATLEWLSTPREGVHFIAAPEGLGGLQTIERGPPGAHPAGWREEEGRFHDHEERGLGQARSEGAA